MTRLLYAGKLADADAWRDMLLSLRPDLDLAMEPSTCDPSSVDILLYEPSGTVNDLRLYSGVSAIQSLWAGVETLLRNETLPKEPPLLRMVENGMTEGMTDYVVGHVYRAHLGVAAQQRDQSTQIWGNTHPPLSQDRKVGIIGLGALGRDAAETLSRSRFDVSGWSRSLKEIEGVRCFSGKAGLSDMLSETEILVLLAPLTPDTENLMNAAAFSQMPHGAHIINASRGPIIDDDALLAALDSGQIATATLDVFREEPLPQENAFWSHPSVMVTPHVASVTRMKSAAQMIIEQVERFETGQPFLHMVDRERGY